MGRKKNKVKRGQRSTPKEAENPKIPQRSEEARKKKGKPTNNGKEAESRKVPQQQSQPKFSSNIQPPPKCNHECPEMNSYQWAYFLELAMTFCTFDLQSEDSSQWEDILPRIGLKYVNATSDPNTIKIAICLAANVFLTKGTWENVDYFTMEAVNWYLNASDQMEIVQSFWRMGDDRVSNPNQRTMRKGFRDHWKRKHQLSNTIDLFVYLDRKLPCNCLERMKEWVRLNLPDTHKCNRIECDNWCEAVDVFTCSNCNRCQYCSRECQVADWPKHKVICRYFQGKTTYEEYEEAEKAVFD